MNVLGNPIPDEDLQRLLSWARQRANFTMFELSSEAYRMGYTKPEVAARIADRLLQKWKKTGTVTMEKYGLWVAPPESSHA